MENLSRFIDAQHDVFDRALSELRAGKKTSHWMWFIFPQIAGLSPSARSREFSLASVDEAKSYLDHPVLGPRFHAAVAAAIDSLMRGRAACVETLFGDVDARKFHASVTLFAEAAPEEALFQEAIRSAFQGRLHEETLSRISN